MESKKWARLGAFTFLFLTIHILPITNSFIATAQTVPTPPNLEGTEWRVTTTDFYYTSPGTGAPIFYVIERGKVTWVAVFTYFTGIRPPGTLGSGDPGNLGADTKVLTGDGGTYKQVSSSVRIEFHDHVIDAVITGNRMEGEVRSKNSAKSAKWSAVKTTKGAKQSGDNTITSGEATGSISNMGNSVSSAQSLAVPVTLTIGQRLPEQLSHFKRTSFHPSREDNTGGAVSSINNEGTLSTRRKDGSIDSAWASYGDIEVIITWFEDAAKARNSMREWVNSQSSGLIVKQMLVKNRVGESVGELVVAQNPQKQSDSLQNEIVGFTYGVYYYTIYSRNFGDAQELQRLLPLEDNIDGTDSRTMPGTTGVSRKLKLGTYRASAQESGPLCYGTYTITTSATLNIKIESIDRDGNIRATAMSPGKGPLKGRIDGNGNLHMEGFISRSSQSEFKFSLKATVEDDVLTNGKYILVGICNEMKGTFNRAIWQEDF